MTGIGHPPQNPPRGNRVLRGLRRRAAARGEEATLQFLVDKTEKVDLNGIGEELGMLGPALSLLLAQLHERANSPIETASLTNYEKLVYFELRELFEHSAIVTPGMEASSVMKSLADIKAKRSTGGPPGLQAPSINEYFQHIIRPDDDDEERPRLQLNCGRKDCPNKKFK